MPELNSWWEKYGCDICNKYQLLVIDLNVKPADTKQGFIDYCDTNNVNYPGIWSGDGGRDLADAMGLGVSANSKFLIKPDRSFSSGVYSTTLKNEGIIEHECDPVNKLIEVNRKKDIGVIKTENGFQLKNVDDRFTSIKLFDLQGKQIWTKELDNKNCNVNIPNNIGKGLKIISLISSDKSVNLSIMFEK